MSLQTLSQVLSLLQELLLGNPEWDFYSQGVYRQAETIPRKFMQKPHCRLAVFCPPDTCFLPHVACDAQKTQRTAAAGPARAATARMQGKPH